ncbi:sensor histidine kinase [Brachybacterium squillarum]|uniref:sensor histidine kinase n=1 Tax=Brachybacterium squillarum TaxID=661979 RepID=UPI0004940373|nr:histidine kinase [Brachybacterium squillarum]
MEASGMPRRRLWQEVAIAVALAAELALVTTVTVPSSPLWPTLALGAATLAGLLLRHRHWRWVLPLVVALAGVGALLTPLVIGTYAYATRSRSRLRTVLLLVLAVLASAVPAAALPGLANSLIVLALTALCGVAAATLGMYTAARRQLLAEFRTRAEDAEADRESAEEQARRAERTRIAREMHDIVAHKISLVALQAGALEVNPAMEHEQVRQSAALIRSTATTALSELREVLGVLRGEGEEAPLVPQPTWEDVRSLVDATKEAGVTVELFDFIDDPVPDAMARTAYRVVQEGLTNIHKHARHTRARVALIGEPGSELVIEISNVLPKGFTTDLPGARMGLSGIETRVAHAGGTITSGPTEDGRFEVKAVIPWPRT